ncbi:hypothetical protein [Edaphobacter sp. 12200R-103]|jgi:hypothetical protein|uniref:hypothetical protein n=1 Tax=Edaphobacter sp. 12200R-103 TaxID=2703788 RepID=UPI00138B4779|nr:hypothetical protein [Edaphobacter sp. 12200R-103]QHS50543.1 hypothetical protein GWR55_01355 [Edaphobacter sp. 12200R-103]
MPEKKTIERAKEDLREGKAPSTAAGEFVREEIDHVREGKHGARSPQQAIAIGLSKARRAGIPLKPPKSGSKEMRNRAEHEYEEGQEHPGRKPSTTRSHSRKTAMKREPKSSASHEALSRQSKRASARRSASSRSAAARKGAAKRSPAARSASARKAARTRAAAH